ncbi:MAG: FmdB family zinc ribbon protein [bacterium]
MPIHEYECKKCGITFEVYQRITETGKDVKCPACGAEYPERKISAFSSCGTSSSSSYGGGGSCSSGGHSSGFG